MKKCRKNFLLILEFIAMIISLVTISPWIIYGSFGLSESITISLVNVELYCKSVIFPAFILFVTLIALIVRRCAYKRNKYVSFPYHKAVIYPLISYVLALCTFLLFQIYKSTIINEVTGQFTVYGLICTIIIVLFFYCLLARVIYKKDKKFIPCLFNLILFGLFIGNSIVLFENSEYINAMEIQAIKGELAFYSFATVIIGALNFINYIILVFGLSKQSKFEQKKQEIIKQVEEQPVEEEKASEEKVSEEKVSEETLEEQPVEEEKVIEETLEEQPVLEEKVSEETLEEQPVEETPQTQETLEPIKSLKAKKVIKPTPQALLKFVQDNFEDVLIVRDPDGASFKVSRKKKVFINLKVGANDYRITFQRKPSTITRFIVKYPSIVKATSPSGDQWFKLVNKGDFTEADLHNLIKGSYAYSVEEEQKEALRKQKEKEKEALRKQKEKEKEALRKQKEKEKEAEKRKKEKEKAKLAATKQKATK